jgi:DNA-binding HxlR family transcriptional regulator
MSTGEGAQPRRISFLSKNALPQKLRDTPNSAWQQSSSRAAAAVQSAPQAKKRTSSIARVGHALWNDSSSEAGDAHAAERDMFDEIMGPTRHRSVIASTTNLTEAAAAAVAAAKPTADGELDRALADKLAKRNCSLLSSVKQLEQQAKQHKRDIAAALETKRELMQQLDAASGGSAEAMLAQQLKVLAENDRLRKQVQEMETFLSDYGLIWVGPKPEDCAEAGGSQLQGDACRSLLPQAGGPGVDLDLLLCKMAELNRVVEEERGVIVTRNKRAQFRRPEVVPLRVFTDGIAVGAGGALRPYADADLQAFMRDILDGYFPSEFRTGYPDGFVILAEDRRRESGLQAGAKLTPFSGDGQRLGSSSGSRSGSSSGSSGYVTAIGAAVLDTAPVFEFRAAASAAANDDAQSVSASSDSSSEPSISSAAVAPAVSTAGTAAVSYVTVVVAETAVALQLREAAASAASSTATATAATDSTMPAAAAVAVAADVATIQVRSPDTGQTLIVKLLTSDTVGDLKDVVARHLATDGLQFEMRTAFPSRAHRDVGQTLAEAGLAPSATVMLRRVVQLASPRQL